MQYARRQRAKGRRPLINSAALPGQKAALTDLLALPPAPQSAIEITALFGASSITRQVKYGKSCGKLGRAARQCTRE
jgi:hypothetical protein